MSVREAFGGDLMMVGRQCYSVAMAPGTDAAQIVAMPTMLQQGITLYTPMQAIALVVGRPFCKEQISYGLALQGKEGVRQICGW